MSSNSNNGADCSDSDAGGAPTPMFPRFLQLVGSTSLVDLSALLDDAEVQRGVKVLGKCEFQNPAMSLKDRMASFILDEATRREDLKTGQTILVASSGNTGCAVAAFAAMRGHPCVVLTSPKCSAEKRAHIEAFGAKVRVLESGYDKAAASLAAENGWFDVNQYENKDNTHAHFSTLGPEIWQQVNNRQN